MRFLPSSFCTSHNLVVPSLENVANTVLSGSTRTLQGQQFGYSLFSLDIYPLTLPIDAVLVFVYMSNQLAFRNPPRDHNSRFTIVVCSTTDLLPTRGLETRVLDQLIVHCLHI